MNVEDQITYFVLKNLVHHTKKDLSLYQKTVKRANQIDPTSTHIVADTIKLIDWHHNQFLNCVIHLKNNTSPVPDLKSGSSYNQNWVTRIGQLELKRLINDYRN